MIINKYNNTPILKKIDLYDDTDLYDLIVRNIYIKIFYFCFIVNFIPSISREKFVSILLIKQNIFYVKNFSPKLHKLGLTKLV